MALKSQKRVVGLITMKTSVWKYVSEDFKERFQIVIRRADVKNVLVLRVAVTSPDSAPTINHAIEDHLATLSHAWVLNRKAGSVATVEVELVDYSRFVMGSDIGKLECLHFE